MSTWATLPGALSVELAGSYIYAGTLAPMDNNGQPVGKGTVVRFRRDG